MCQSVATNAKQDLEAVVRLFYNTQNDHGMQDSSCPLVYTLIIDYVECNTEMPYILWSLYFNLDMCNMKQDSLNSSVNKFSNLYLTSDPDSTMTYEAAVKEVYNHCTH